MSVGCPEFPDRLFAGARRRHFPATKRCIQMSPISTPTLTETGEPHYERLSSGAIPGTHGLRNAALASASSLQCCGLCSRSYVSCPPTNFIGSEVIPRVVQQLAPCRAPSANKCTCRMLHSRAADNAILVSASLAFLSVFATYF